MVNKYYQKHKEKLRKEARERYQSFSEKEKEKKTKKKVQDKYQNLSEEEKEKKRQYHRERNKNLSEEEKKKVECMRNYYIAHKLLFRVL